MVKFELRKLNQLFISAVISFASMTSFAGTFVNNGGGIAEKNILYAYEKLDTYLQLCLNSNTCKLTADQGSLLLQIYRALPQERQTKQLFFGSEKKNPGSFMIDGNVRVARTGDEIGSPIYINSDLLYTKGDGDSYDPVRFLRRSRSWFMSSGIIKAIIATKNLICSACAFLCCYSRSSSRLR